MKETHCPWCDAIFADSSALERHTKAVHDKVPVFQCKKCTEKFRGSDEFDLHLTQVHGTTHWNINLLMKQAKRWLRSMEE